MVSPVQVGRVDSMAVEEAFSHCLVVQTCNWVERARAPVEVVQVLGLMGAMAHPCQAEEPVSVLPVMFGAAKLTHQVRRMASHRCCH